MQTPAVLVLCLLVVAAPVVRAEQDVQLLYARPDAANASVDDYQFTTWTPGTRLFVAPLRIHLRERPGTAGANAGKVGLGDAIVVKARDPARRREDGLVNHWYQVQVAGGALKGRTGWVFGAHLTPFALHADFDGDRAEETATISFDSGMKIHVRVLDRKGGQEEDVAELALVPSGEAYLSRKGGQVSASLLPAAKAGVPLVKLASVIEACGDHYDAYVSYTSGKAREALMLRGVSDPPVSQITTATFSPGKAQVEEVVVEQDDKGKERRLVTRKTLLFEQGAFREKK